MEHGPSIVEQFRFTKDGNDFVGPRANEELDVLVDVLADERQLLECIKAVVDALTRFADLPDSRE
jgi:hypothetical protein